MSQSLHPELLIAKVRPVFQESAQCSAHLKVFSSPSHKKRAFITPLCPLLPTRVDFEQPPWLASDLGFSSSFHSSSLSSPTLPLSCLSSPRAPRESFGSLEEVQHMAPALPQVFSPASQQAVILRWPATIQRSVSRLARM